MKPKGISLIELHCEKIFLAVLAVAALGVVALQFTGDGNTVQVGSGGEYRLDQAYEEVAELAESKLGQLEATTPSPQAPKADSAFADEFLAALSAESSPAPAEAVALARPYPPVGDVVVDPNTALRVAEVDPGVPAKPITGVFLGTIDPTADTLQSYNDIYGQGDWPRDVRALSVETTYAAGALRQRLRTDPDGDGPLAPAPVGFWNNRHLIAGVIVERQQQTEGGWSDPVRLPSPPGALDTSEMLEQAGAQGLVGNVLGLLKGDRGWEVVAPAFAPTRAGWWPPSFAARAENGGDVVALQYELQSRIERGADLRDVETESVWTHDYGVQPGEMYRYRVRLAIPNPYFGFSVALAEESRGLAEEGFLYTEFSEWSEPVSAPRESYWFAFSATDGRDNAIAGGASCRLDVYGFVDGQWRMKQARFEPGDEIRVTVADDDGGERVVDTGARLVDVVRTALTEPGARPGRQDAPMQVVAASGEGLDLREVWRDRVSAQRRDLAAAAARPAEADVEGEARPERAPRQERERDEDRGRPAERR